MTRPPCCGIVAIGRNEGERLKRCLAAVSDPTLTVYVDSGSTDGSVAWAEDRGIEVIALDMRTAFTAARARNAGFARLMAVAPDLAYVQFVDGDCELVPDWPARATAFLAAHPQAAIVFGRRRERHPEQSVYNWLCDQEWNVPIGEVKYCGGDAMVRTQALSAVGGYRDSMIAGEEPELCVRLRAAGWSIWRIDHEMTRHDADIRRFGQWWRRSVRSGYAFAEGAHLHGRPPERFWVWESRRAWIWGLGLPLATVLGFIAIGPPGLLLLLLFPLQLLKQVVRTPGPWRSRFWIAWFQLLARFAEVIGQLKFLVRGLSGRKQGLIEYK